MTLTRTHLIPWLGSAVLLAVVLYVFALTVPAFAHGGHDCDKVGAASAVPKNEIAVINDAVAIEAKLIGTGTETTTVRQSVPLVKRHILHEASLEQLLAVASAVGRVVCPCGTGCGSCSSASCCAGALLPPVLYLGAPSAAIEIATAVVPGAPGIFGDPLPRPPNPVRRL